MHEIDSSIKFRTLGQTSLVDQIIEHFTQALIRGDLRRGQRLPTEAELCTQFGVGRSAIREAMKILEALGVITIRRGEGTFVVDEVSPAIFDPLIFAMILGMGMSQELAELRRLFEIGYCELASKNASAEDWQRIEQAAQALEHYAVQPDPTAEKLTSLDLAFHHAVLEASHNALVIRLGQAIEELFFASIRNVYLTLPDNLHHAPQFHRGIISAMRSGNPEAIRMAIDASLVYWTDEVRKLGEKVKTRPAIARKLRGQQDDVERKAIN